MRAIDRAAARTSLRTGHRGECLAVVGNVQDREVCGAAVFGGNAYHEHTIAARSDGVIPTQLRHAGAADRAGAVEGDGRTSRTSYNKQTSEPQERGREVMQGIFDFHGGTVLGFLPPMESTAKRGKTKSQG